MTARRPIFILLFANLLFTSCAIKSTRMNVPPETSIMSSYAIVQATTPGIKYIVVRDSHALTEALRELNCDKTPCAVGLVGELYAISQTAKDEIKPSRER